MSAGRFPLTALRAEETRRRLEAFLAEAGAPAYRARQILTWVYDRGARSIEEMRDLPHGLRAALAERFVVHSLRREREAPAGDDACKHLFLTREGHPVESVSIPVPDGATYCLSVASGCPVGCRFCASGTFFNRFLAPGEIVDQYLLMKAAGGRTPAPSGIVLMGMGEPLLNWRGTRGFLAAIGGDCGVGARRITVSTVGVPGRIEALGREFPQVKLAVSLHAADDGVRAALIPAAARMPIAELMAACRAHAELTGGKRITFEYVLLAGVNDGPRAAAGLAALLRGLPAGVNLIPYNPVEGADFVRPSDAAVEAFAAALRRRFAGEATLRRSFGGTANAACGQLGSEHARGRGARRERDA